MSVVDQAFSLSNPDFIRRLDSLALLARRILGGSLQADRKTIKKGAGITFADYAEYNAGDDYRAIDWKVYARSDDLVIRQFEIEEDATVAVLLDCSPSMREKFDYARQLAAAIAYIAVAGLDRLRLDGLAEDVFSIQGPCHGRANILPLLRNLEQLTVQGKDSDFARCARRFVSQVQRRCLVVVISDFLFPAGFHEGLRLLNYNRHEVFCLQVLHPQELICDWKGDVDLTCVETGSRRRITVTPREAAAYAQAMADWNQELERSCKRSRLGHARTTSDRPFDSVIQDLLRRGGLIA